ncbi:serine/threonine-protein kinase [Thermomonospora umbrina]|uniref:non-specific serine/threonine protein kinase n=1 Tax=Thermomonospora umbrina TaxID=111806 RepID=A0A3D9T3Y9_9ACTN|nr:serine/threonine-protein kinase [Thermomonospora umbrina]REE98531.1 serine/threonine protein kinase [Thermomonospora umbrina]
MAGTRPGAAQEAYEGRRIGGRYLLESMLGRGGMGAVWRARDEMLDRDVAVKEVVLRHELSDAERAKARERTLREARATARLTHPGIVTVHDVVDEDDRPWIVMELVRARSLQQILDDGGPLPPRRVADIGRQMASALRAAHAVGILHRDVKPANVLVTEEWRAVLTDFGIARMMGDAMLTQTGLLIGSPAYMPPERAKGEPATPASDLWSLGATLYAACEGRPPHERSEIMAVLAAVMTEDPPPPRNAGPLTPVIGGLLLRDPVHRMTAPQAEQGLAQVAAGGVPVPHDTAMLPAPEAGTLLTSPPPPPSGGSASRTGVLAVLGVVAVIATLVAVALAIRPDSGGGGGGGGGPQAGGGTTRSASPSSPSSPDTRPTTGPAATDDAVRPIPGIMLVGRPGFEIGVPVGWRMSVQGNSVFWNDPASEAYVQVDQTIWSGDPMEHWREWEGEVVARNALTGYRRVGLRPTGGVGYRSADLEFTWRSRDGVPMHGIDRGAVVNGRPFAVFVAIPQERWDDSREKVNNILDTFRP